MALDIPMGTLLPADAVADILFNIGDSHTRAAFRVSCRFWMNVGENVRAIIELRCPTNGFTLLGLGVSASGRLGSAITSFTSPMSVCSRWGTRIGMRISSANLTCTSMQLTGAGA